LQDESFKSILSIIEQYLSRTNKNATIPISQKVLELNKAHVKNFRAVQQDTVASKKELHLRLDERAPHLLVFFSDGCFSPTDT
jgi:hypothetical protein